jgi:hypothetical protein
MLSHRCGSLLDITRMAVHTGAVLAQRTIEVIDLPSVGGTS